MSQRILIVDDSSSDLKMLANVLRDEFAVSLASSGREALELAVREPPDLLLLDILMPDMDGFAVLDAWLAQEVTRGIPVIFLTVLEAVEDKIRGLAAGAVDYITKPFEPLEVKARVRVHLALRRALRQLEEQNEELRRAARLREEVEAIARHDLKNPLHTILCATDLVPLHGPLTPEQREDLATVQRAAVTILDIINRYFDLFRIEHGLYRFEPVEVDLVAVARRVVKDINGLFQQKGLRIDLRFRDAPLAEDDRLFVRGEETLCYSLLANLVKNAMEASPPNALILIAFDEEEGRPTVRITNEGEVPEEMRPRFFAKFATAGKEHGTGLGTYSARRIAELLGGSVELLTDVPGRTTVRVQLCK